MNQKQLESAIRRVSNDPSLEPQVGAACLPACCLLRLTAPRKHQSPGLPAVPLHQHSTACKQLLHSVQTAG